MKVAAVVGAVRSAVGYLVYEDAGGPAIIIDTPYKTATLFLQAIEKAGVTVELVINTHGHWDQIADNKAVCEATGAPLCAHVWDATRIADPRLGTERKDEHVPALQGKSIDRYLHDNEEIQVGGLKFQALHTPGHTPGSICLYEAARHALFVGDLMTRGSVSRTDFVGANARQLSESLLRISHLPDVTLIYPGHGIGSSLQKERWLLELANVSSTQA